MNRKADIAARAKQRCLRLVEAFEADTLRDNWDYPTRDWWQDTWSGHGPELADRIEALLRGAHEEEEGCLTYGPLPLKVMWRGHQQRAYQLVAWGLSEDLPTRRAVIRHLCNNERCIHPDHLQVGTQRENLADQRQRRADYWADQ